MGRAPVPRVALWRNEPHARGFMVAGTARQLCSLDQLPYPTQGPPSCGFRRLSCRPLKTWLAPRTPTVQLLPRSSRRRQSTMSTATPKSTPRAWRNCCTRCRRCGSAISPSAWPATRVGIAGKIADTFNEIVAANERMAQQLEHVGQVVGREGKTRQRVRFGLRAAPGARWRARSTR